jgi:hypothetical protein
MAVLVHEPGFSIVESSWSGSVVVTIGGTDVTVTGETDSPASIWIRLVEQCTLTHGGSWIGWSEHGVLYIQSSLSFTLTSSGSVQTRLIWSDGTAGATIMDTWANIYDWQDDFIGGAALITVDLWMGGRGFGRYIIENATTKRISSLIDYAELDCSLRGVK